MPDKIEGCKLCLCKCGDEYVPGVHIEFTRNNGKLFDVPVNTKIDQSDFDYKLGEYDSRRAISYIENGYAKISDGYLNICIEGKTIKTPITEERFGEMVNE